MYPRVTAWLKLHVSVDKDSFQQLYTSPHTSLGTRLVATHANYIYVLLGQLLRLSLAYPDSHGVWLLDSTVMLWASSPIKKLTSILGIPFHSCFHSHVSSYNDKWKLVIWIKYLTTSKWDNLNNEGVISRNVFICTPHLTSLQLYNKTQEHYTIFYKKKWTHKSSWGTGGKPLCNAATRIW